MVPLIPYEFDPPASDYETAHLKFHDVEGGQIVSWPLVGASLFFSGERYYPSLDKLEANNGGLFKAHGLHGFSAGTYHEFLVNIQTDGFGNISSRFGGFRMGSVEATFGLATPLAALVFSAYHRSKYFGDWDQIASLRIVGVNIDEVEAAFINACDVYKEKFGSLPALFPLDESLLFAEDEEGEEAVEPEIVTIPPMTINIVPLRFLYSGLSQLDDAAACIYYYRVVEYFSFFTNASEMNKLRHDSELSDAEFSKRILDLITKDERGPVYKLIASIADDRLLAKAVSDKLIGNAAANTLSETLYAFRNSIVHGKFSYGYALQSVSVLDEDPTLPRWRALLRDLARRALSQYGSKKT